MSCTWNRRWLQAADRLVCLVLITVASGRLLLEQTRVPRLRPLDEARTSPPPVYVVDINRAAWPELTLLPGIGPTLAKRIVAERRRRGLYRRPDDLLRVSGIGPRKLTALRPHVRIEPAATFASSRYATHSQSSARSSASTE